MFKTTTAVRLHRVNESTEQIREGGRRRGAVIQEEWADFGLQ